MLQWKFCACNKHMLTIPKVFTAQLLSNYWPLYKLWWPIAVCEQRTAAGPILMNSLAAVFRLNWRKGEASQETTQVYWNWGRKCRISWECANYENDGYLFEGIVNWVLDWKLVSKFKDESKCFFFFQLKNHLINTCSTNHFFFGFFNKSFLMKGLSKSFLYLL